MPRRKSLIAQMFEARQKAKLQQQKLEDQASRAWAAEERKVAGQKARQAAQLRQEEDRVPKAGLPSFAPRARVRRSRDRQGHPATGRRP
jgi:hypothetical protein